MSDQKETSEGTPKATPVSSEVLRQAVAKYRWSGSPREREKQ